MVSFLIKLRIQIEHFRPPASQGPFGAVFGPPEVETDPTPPKRQNISQMNQKDNTYHQKCVDFGEST